VTVKAEDVRGEPDGLTLDIAGVLRVRTDSRKKTDFAAVMAYSAACGSSMK
jgi:hypothetical protein